MAEDKSSQFLADLFTLILVAVKKILENEELLASINFCDCCLLQA